MFIVWNRPGWAGPPLFLDFHVSTAGPLYPALEKVSHWHCLCPALHQLALELAHFAANGWECAQCASLMLDNNDGTSTETCWSCLEVVVQWSNSIFIVITMISVLKLIWGEKMVKKVAVTVQNMQTGFIVLSNMWKTHQHLLRRSSWSRSSPLTVMWAFEMLGDEANLQ